MPKIEITYQQVLEAVKQFAPREREQLEFWELSFFGTPEERDGQREELRERVRRIDAGEEKLIPLEDLWRELEER